MKKFYDRQQEMNQLLDMQQQAYMDYSRFVVLTGRRRVGKTSLVYRLMEETKAQAPGLYFFVGRKTEASLVASFCEEVRTKLDEFVPEGIASFRILMQLLLEIGKRKNFTLFIDEFQEFDNVNSEVFSDVQELWDRYKKETHVCLIVSGSIFRFWFRYIHRHNALIEIQNMPALEQIMKDDYQTFSGISLERWFRQKMMESHRYQTIGGWWMNGGVNAKGNRDDFEIDIVAETLESTVEAYEVKRNPQKYNPTRLQEKVDMMQRHLFRGKQVKIGGLSMEEM